MALRTYYPRENLLPNDQALALWYEQLKDLDYTEAETALKAWVATNKWSPSIAELREQAAEIRNGAIQDWSEAWEQVIKAIGRFGYYDEERAMNSMDEMTQVVVKRLGFRNLCMSENLTAERANFRMIYEQIATRKKKEQQIPPQVLEAMRSLQQGSREKKLIEMEKECEA